MNGAASIAIPIATPARFMPRLFGRRPIVARTNNWIFWSAATMLLSDSKPAAFGADCERPTANLMIAESA
jgi:hypothetical protein